MKNYTKVDPSETHLESLVQERPDLIEPQLTYLTHQTHTIGGRLDVLLADNGTFVVAELKKVEDDGMLLQALTYYDYVSSNVEAFARLYKGIEPTKPGRLLLIAPSFSQKLINWCKWIDVNITLVTYQCLKFEGDSDVVPVFAPQEFPDQPPILSSSTIDEHLAYITDKAVQDEARNLLNEIKTWKPGITVEAIRSGISIKHTNRLIAYFRPRRKTYVIATFDLEGEWTEHSLATYDLETVKSTIRNVIKTRFNS